MNRKKNVIITGCCGFIGFSLSKKLLENKNLKVIGLDTINNYYDVGYSIDLIFLQLVLARMQSYHLILLWTI